MSRHSLSNHIFCLALVLCLSLLTGCVDDFRHRSIFDGGAGSAFIGFSVENVVLTRDGDGQDKESLIDHAYLLFYDADASLQSALPVAAVRAEIDAANPGKLEFKMPLHLAPNTDYQLLALANADYYVPSGFDTYGEYLDSWCKSSAESRQELILWHGDRILAETIECLPMHGRIPESAKFSFTIENGVYHVASSLSFRRSVARIDLTNQVGSGFIVEGVALCNWRDAVSGVAFENKLGNRVGTVRGVLSDDGVSSGEDIFVKMPSAGDDGVQQLKKAIYCFPSVSYDSFQSDKETTALIIKATYKDDVEPTYYRVNVGTSGNNAEVKANTKYLVNIQSVKGSGAPSAKEAYLASESLIVLSVVEDWDIDGGSFAMDENGNFIVLSTGRLEFDGESTDSMELKILTSKGMTLSARYEADNEASADAFTATLVSESPISTLKVSPATNNDSNDILSGKFVVSARTPEGGSLSVDLLVMLNPTTGVGNEPLIPSDMPFALIPESYERVKIDHVKRTIEIDGFDPSCVNSFIDIPFSVYIKNTQGGSSKVNISTGLQWPLEGRISVEKSSKYKYCKESFDSEGLVLDESGNSILYSTLYKESLALDDKEEINLSVGAMGPDDPAIIRTITLSGNNEEITYALTIKPRPCIIDDVILTDNTGNSWMIMDRNVQEMSLVNWYAYVGRDEKGNKYQAYNYIDQSYLKIPFKYDAQGNAFSEDFHLMNRGYRVTKTNRNSDKQNSKRVSTMTKEWLEMYKIHDASIPAPELYSDNHLYSWTLPLMEHIELCCERMKVSKMRLFLISEIQAQYNEQKIPICCYWPYMGLGPNEYADPKYGYYITTSGYEYLYATDMLFIFYNGVEVKCYHWPTTTKGSDYGFIRLVRPLTEEELSDYKINYLGYGKDPHRLTICHPDTYESKGLGWLPY